MMSNHVIISCLKNMIWKKQSFLTMKSIFDVVVNFIFFFVEIFYLKDNNSCKRSVEYD